MQRAIAEEVQVGDWVEVVTPDGETLEGVAGRLLHFVEDGIAYVEIVLAVGDDWTVIATRDDHPVLVG